MTDYKYPSSSPENVGAESQAENEAQARSLFKAIKESHGPSPTLNIKQVEDYVKFVEGTLTYKGFIEEVIDYTFTLEDEILRIGGFSNWYHILTCLMSPIIILSTTDKAYETLLLELYMAMIKVLGMQVVDDGLQHKYERVQNSEEIQAWSEAEQLELDIAYESAILFHRMRSVEESESQVHSLLTRAKALGNPFLKARALSLTSRFYANENMEYEAFLYGQQAVIHGLSHYSAREIGVDSLSLLFSALERGQNHIMYIGEILSYWASVEQDMPQNVRRDALLQGQMGAYYYKRKKYRVAVKHLEEAATKYESLHNLMNAGRCLNSMGVPYYRIGEKEKAFESLDNAAKKFKHLKLYHLHANSIAIKGWIHGQEREFDAATKCFELARTIAKKDEERYSAILQEIDWLEKASRK